MRQTFHFFQHSNGLKIGIISFILFLISSFFFFQKLKEYPFQYYDEQWWIGTSYFFDLVIRRDFSNPEWFGYYGFDQPKLTEYFFGAVLYPQYLFEKHDSSSYQDFLAQNGFGGRTTVIDQKSNKVLGTWSWVNEIDGKTPYSINQEDLRNSSDIVTTIRKANAIILAFGVILMFILTFEIIGKFGAGNLITSFSMCFSLILG